MDWKKSRAVGAIALILIVASVAVLVVFFTKSQTGYGRKMYFVCESTGERFFVHADPLDKEYVEEYMLMSGMAAKCKVCGKKDAYATYQHPSGKWLRGNVSYFLCESTGETFFIPNEPEVDGYERSYARSRSGTALSCKICAQVDCYRAELSSQGIWEKAPEGATEFVEPIPEGIELPVVEGEETGWDSIVRAQGDREGGRRQPGGRRGVSETPDAETAPEAEAVPESEMQEAPDSPEAVEAQPASSADSEAAPEAP